MFYNFGTTHDIKRKLYVLSRTGNVFENDKFLDTLAPQLRGKRNVEDVQDALETVSNSLKIDLLPSTRYDLIEALCDDNDFLNAVIFDEPESIEEAMREPFALDIGNIVIAIAITAYMIWAVSSIATLFFSVDQVLTVLAQILYPLTLFAVVFLLPLWLISIVGYELLSVTFAALTSLFNTINQLIDGKDSDRLSRAQKKAERRAARLVKDVEAYRKDPKVWLTNTCVRIYRVVLPVAVIMVIVAIAFMPISRGITVLLGITSTIWLLVPVGIVYERMRSIKPRLAQ